MENKKDYLMNMLLKWAGTVYLQTEIEAFTYLKEAIKTAEQNGFSKEEILQEFENNISLYQVRGGYQQYNIVSIYKDKLLKEGYTLEWINDYEKRENEKHNKEVEEFNRNKDIQNKVVSENVIKIAKKILLKFQQEQDNKQQLDSTNNYAEIPTFKLPTELLKKLEMQGLLENTTGQKATRTDFIRWAAVLSKYIGYRVDLMTVTVTEFLEIDKMMKEATTEKAHRA